MMNIFGLTDIGLVRKENQDSYAVRFLDEGLAIAAVCDGMGGAQAGNVASAVAVEAFAACLEESCKQGLPPDRERREELLRHACKQANGRVYELSEKNEEYHGMGTTLVGALILAHEMYLINVGDSRGYILQNGQLTQITQDHSYVQALIDRGSITKEEGRTHPKKNLITRALGIDRDVRPDVFPVEYHAGDSLLLCSDGLSNVVTEDLMTEELKSERSADQIARRLLELAVAEGAPDNVTAVVVRL